MLVRYEFMIAEMHAASAVIMYLSVNWKYFLDS